MCLSMHVFEYACVPVLIYMVCVHMYVYHHCYIIWCGTLCIAYKWIVLVLFKYSIVMQVLCIL